MASWQWGHIRATSAVSTGSSLNGSASACAVAVCSAVGSCFSWFSRSRAISSNASKSFTDISSRKNSATLHGIFSAISFSDFTVGLPFNMLLSVDCLIFISLASV